MAMPRHVPNDQSRAEVRALSGFGIPHDNIAKHIGIAPKTLRKWYAHELDTGSIAAHAKVAGFIFKAASGMALTDGASYADCLRSAFFYAKTQMQWRETEHSEVLDASPPTIVINMPKTDGD